MHEKIKKWYTQGLWSRAMVEQAAARGVLTHEQAGDVLAPKIGAEME